MRNCCYWEGGSPAGFLWKRKVLTFLKCLAVLWVLHADSGISNSQSETEAEDSVDIAKVSVLKFLDS